MIRMSARGMINSVFFLMSLLPFLALYLAEETGLFEGREVVAFFIGLGVFLIGFFAHFFLMLIDSIRQSRVAWTLAIFFLSPFGCWFYFLLVYVRRGLDIRIGAKDLSH